MNISICGQQPWGNDLGGWGKRGKKTQKKKILAREKKLNSTTRKKKNSSQQPGRKKAQLKKAQLNNLEEKKVHRLVAEEKKSTAGWPGKKLNSRLAGEKTQHEFSARGPPKSLMVRP